MKQIKLDFAGWYSGEISSEKKASNKDVEKLAPQKIVELLRKASQIYESRATEEHKSIAKQKKNTDWLKTVTKSGTLADKLAALTLQVVENPLVQLGNYFTFYNIILKAQYKRFWEWLKRRRIVKARWQSKH
jgi:hypothetical protein